MAWSFQRFELTARINAHWTELDGNAKIDADFAHRFAEIGKGTLRILTGIAYHNVMTAAQHHFVETQVFEMATV